MLADEEDAGRTLIMALPPELQKQAIVNPVAPGDILTMNNNNISPLADQGVLYSALPAQHQALLTKLSSGDEVVTTGGLLGKVVDVGDTFLTLEVAEGVRVKVQKFQVASLMPKGTLKSA